MCIVQAMKAQPQAAGTGNGDLQGILISYWWLLTHINLRVTSAKFPTLFWIINTEKIPHPRMTNRSWARSCSLVLCLLWYSRWEGKKVIMEPSVCYVTGKIIVLWRLQLLRKTRICETLSCLFCKINIQSASSQRSVNFHLTYPTTSSKPQSNWLLWIIAICMLWFIFQTISLAHMLNIRNIPLPFDVLLAAKAS